MAAPSCCVEEGDEGELGESSFCLLHVLLPHEESAVSPRLTLRERPRARRPGTHRRPVRHGARRPRHRQRRRALDADNDAAPSPSPLRHPMPDTTGGCSRGRGSGGWFCCRLCADEGDLMRPFPALPRTPGPAHPSPPAPFSSSCWARPPLTPPPAPLRRSRAPRGRRARAPQQHWRDLDEEGEGDGHHRLPELGD